MKLSATQHKKKADPHVTFTVNVKHGTNTFKTGYISACSREPSYELATTEIKRMSKYIKRMTSYFFLMLK